MLQLDPGGSTAMFGVFDGHGGKQVAKYTAQHLVRFNLACEARWRVTSSTVSAAPCPLPP